MGGVKGFQSDEVMSFLRLRMKQRASKVMRLKYTSIVQIENGDWSTWCKDISTREKTSMDQVV